MLSVTFLLALIGLDCGKQKSVLGDNLGSCKPYWLLEASKMSQNAGVKLLLGCHFGGDHLPWAFCLELQRGRAIWYLAAQLPGRYVWATDCLLLLQKSLMVFQTTLNACGFPEAIRI